MTTLVSQEGEIYTRRGLDREKKTQYVFTVMLEEKRPSTKVVSCLHTHPSSLSLIDIWTLTDGQRSHCRRSGRER